MPEPRYLTIKQLAEAYPVEDRDNVDCWQRLLVGWRLARLLQISRGDWKQIKEGRCHVRAYSEVIVLRLVWQSSHLYAEAVKITHHAKIERLLLDARTADASTNRTA